MNAAKLIVASTRLPITLSRKGDTWQAEPSTGGLVTALQALAERRAFTWVGWAGTTVKEGERAAVNALLSEHGAVPVYLSKAEAEGHYEGFSNGALWPLFHGLVGRVRYSLPQFKIYEHVNQLFAEEIARRARRQDLIWIHDYQLCLVPEMLRRLGVPCPVGFFLHIPFPSAEVYRSLPAREAILRGMLGADFLGFHAYEYVSHFRNACLRVLGFESEPEAVRLPSHPVRLGVLPIGIDPSAIHEMAEAPEAVEEYEGLRRAYAGKKIVLGVDRLDYTKGILEKLQAFEELLKHSPRWRRRVVLIQVAAPSREAVREYQTLKHETERRVGEINGKYGGTDHTPVVYINQAISRTRLVGMYQAADVALITPVRDGMNLVALEYVAARGPQGGKLILSEFAGAAHLLSGARLVSPYDKTQVAQVLAECLDEPDRPEAFRHMLEFVNRNTSVFWANGFLDRLEETVCAEQAVAPRLRIHDSNVLAVLGRCRKPLLLLDYDGTLRAYERKPMDAVPSARLRELLGELARRAAVYIVSGRSSDVLEQWLGDLPVGLVAEHGFATRLLGRQHFHEQRAAARGNLRPVQELFEDFVKRTPGSTIERKRASVAWHYRSSDPEYGTFQANELLARLDDLLKRRPLQVLRGNQVVEVRHESISKGHAVVELAKHHPEVDGVLCAGDDRTDEDMMRGVVSSWDGRAVTCWVGGRNAGAQYWIESCEALLAELAQLTRLWPAHGDPGLEPAAARAAKRPSVTPPELTPPRPRPDQRAPR